jgi:hypothetical protein
MAESGLRRFVRESNAIKGIERDPYPAEIAAHETLLAMPHVRLGHLRAFVHVVAPGAELRDRVGMDVTINFHVPMPGGPEVASTLRDLLALVNDGLRTSAYETHVAYELLHPFTDGSGRSGRALWAWMMVRSGHDPFALPFLHAFYYQTLDAARRG